MLFLFLFVVGVSSHGMMNIPMPRAAQAMGKSPSFPMFVGGNKSQCVGDGCLWYQVGCYIGCPSCSCKNKEMYPTPEADAKCTNYIEPTLPVHARSWNIENKSPMGDFTKYNPWRSPGRAPVANPCGVASGFISGWPGAEVPYGFTAFTNGTDIPPLSGVPTPVYKAGEVIEVSWGIAANHGGGYQYRLCPADEDITEECFQKMPIPFATSQTKIYYTDGSRKSFTIPAVDASTGTSPKGSTWRRNPIPGCNCDLGFSCSERSNMTTPYEHDPDAPTKYRAHGCTTGLQFPLAWDDGYGQGGSCLYPVGTTKPCDPFRFNMVDSVQVPKDATPGQYILGFRWDCEQTSQVWTQCADVTIE